MVSTWLTWLYIATDIATDKTDLQTRLNLLASNSLSGSWQLWYFIAHNFLHVFPTNHWMLPSRTSHVRKKYCASTTPLTVSTEQVAELLKMSTNLVNSVHRSLRATMVHNMITPFTYSWTTNCHLPHSAAWESRGLLVFVILWFTGG